MAVKFVRDMDTGTFWIVDTTSGNAYQTATDPSLGSHQAAVNLYGPAVNGAISPDGTQVVYPGGQAGFSNQGMASAYFNQAVGVSSDGMEQVVSGNAPDPLTGQTRPGVQTTSGQGNVYTPPSAPAAPPAAPSTGGPAPHPGASGGPSAEEAAAGAPRDYRAEAAVLFPWLTPSLLSLFADEWAKTGRSEIALATVRQSKEYDRIFPGIRREDGSLRYTENQYLAEVAGFREAAAEWGFTLGQDDIKGMFENEVDAREFYRVAQDASTRFMEPGGERTPLADIYIQAFTQGGSQQRALEAARDSDMYDRVFAGNRREDGTLRMDEPDYFAYTRGLDRTLVGFGLNPSEFRARNRYKALIEGEVSVQEVGQRLQGVQDGILDNTQAVMDFYATNYGIQLNPQAILAMAIDPDIQRDVLERRVQAAQVGGEAAVQGFRRSIERAEELARAGLTQGRARELYSGAGARLGGLSATTARHFRGETSIGQYEDALALGDASQQKRFELALQSEKSSFSSAADVRRDRDFGLSGLRQR